jgi:hypothetical protein
MKEKLKSDGYMKVIIVAMLVIVGETVDNTKITYFSQYLSIDTIRFFCGSKLYVYLGRNDDEFDMF